MRRYLTEKLFGNSNITDEKKQELAQSRKTEDQQRTIQKIKEDLSVLIAKLKQIKKLKLQPEQMAFVEKIKKIDPVQGQTNLNEQYKQFNWKSDDKNLNGKFEWTLIWTLFYIDCVINNLNHCYIKIYCFLKFAHHPIPIF